MTRRPSPKTDQARATAARRLMRLLNHEPIAINLPEGSPAIEDAMLEMERVWALAGAVAQDPRIAQAREADLARFSVHNRLKRLGVVAAALALAVTGTLSLSWLQRGTDAPHVATRSFSTGIGQRTRMVLADTSKVTLDTDSAISVRVNARFRIVALQRGRAFFQVAKDKSRPFIVEAGDKRVRATGTAFGVRIENGKVVVTVTEGTVEVTERSTASTPPRHSAEMDAGTELVARTASDWAIRRVDPEQSTSWITGRLTFMGEPLRDALFEMNRYATQKLVFRGDHVPGERIVGVFRAGDTQALAQAIELNGFARIVSTTPDRIEVEAR